MYFLYRRFDYKGLWNIKRLIVQLFKFIKKYLFLRLHYNQRIKQIPKQYISELEPLFSGYETTGFQTKIIIVVHHWILLLISFDLENTEINIAIGNESVNDIHSLEKDFNWKRKGMCMPMNCKKIQMILILEKNILSKMRIYINLFRVIITKCILYFLKTSFFISYVFENKKDFLKTKILLLPVISGQV